MTTNNITKTEIKGSGKSWHFNVYWDNRTYANLVSATYDRKYKAKIALDKYLKDQKIDWYPE